MSYALLRNPLLRIIKAPEEPPPIPPGATPIAEPFHASRRYLFHQLVIWGSGFAMGILVELLLWGIGGIDKIEFGNVITISIPFADWMFFPIELVIALTVLAAIGKYFMIQLDYDLRYYIVTDRNVRIREGVYDIRESTFTFANVQNLNIRQGPIERLFGISTLIVDTAGGGQTNDDDDNDARGHRGVLKGITNPAELRDRIQALLKEYRGTGLGDPDERATPAAATLADDSLLKSIRDELRAVHTLLRR